MERKVGNSTSITEFILLGFPELHRVRMAFFGIVLLMYFVSISGNSFIVTVVFMEARLHTPMYFFLSNVSFTELCSSTVVIPKMLTDILLDQNTICFTCCMLQLLLVFSIGSTQFINLAVMSLDRYLAICRPLRYKTIMTNGLCLQLALMAWVGGFAVTVCQAVFLWNYPFCGQNINHFFCDVGPVLKLVCTDTTTIDLIRLLLGAAVMWGSFILSLVSYTWIIGTIVRIPSETGRSKAFSTCSSHLTLVSLFYGTTFFMYLRPSSNIDSQIDKMVYLVTIVALPTMSPFIFTIRNKDFKVAASKIMARRCHLPSSGLTKSVKGGRLQKRCPLHS